MKIGRKVIDYKTYLISLVKASGQEVIDRAEEMVDGELITDFNITLRFPQGGVPTIEIIREHAVKNTTPILEEMFK